MKISTILDQIELGTFALPEFQRGYVWNRDQVRGLMDSLYRRHPVGSLLVWVTGANEAHIRGDGELPPGAVRLLLDGQQRMTSLYGIIRGKAPKFFDGNVSTFTDLYFNLESEVFEFYGPVKMKDDPLWISVTELMQKGVGEFIQGFVTNPEFSTNLQKYINRLNSIEGIKSVDLHIEEVVGVDKTIDVVVEIFNRVNSGGTKLSKGDLALAKICAGWPEAREEMKARLARWRAAGFHFRLEWFLRNINTILTGEALFSALEHVETQDFKEGLKTAERSVDTVLNMIASRLGLDHDRVLGSRYSLPLMTHYLVRRGGKITDPKERDQLLYWYVHTFLWGRYAGSTESVLNRDLGLIESDDGHGLEQLVQELRQNRGDLRLQANDFQGSSKGARFYPMIYMLTRVCHARDWGTGNELSAHLLGNMSALEIHHIFPKARLYDHGYSRSEVNAIANFTFLTKETNLNVSDRVPAVYLSEIAERNPGVLETHWIPMDQELWHVDRYHDFLAARRHLLAKAANDFLEGLVEGAVPETVEVYVSERDVEAAPGGITTEAEEEALIECNEWVVAKGLPEGEFLHELTDAVTGQAKAILDVAWPDGLQSGLSQPVALLLDEEAETIEAASIAGFKCFTEVEVFKRYVERDVLAAAA